MWPRKCKIRGPSPQRGGECSRCRNLTDAASPLRRGGSDSTVTRTHSVVGEASLVPDEKSPEQGRSYNRLNREVDRRREGGGRVRSSDEAEQCPQSEGTLLFVVSP